MSFVEADALILLHNSRNNCGVRIGVIPSTQTPSETEQQVIASLTVLSSRLKLDSDDFIQ